MRAVVAAIALLAEAQSGILPPPADKFYHGLFYSAPVPGSDDANEHNVTPEEVRKYEQSLGTKTSWVYFSNNWCESREFPAATCRWIRSLGKVPYVRLMLRSDLDQKHAEKEYSLTNICGGRFDRDLRRWAREASNFGSPILIDWGLEPNGQWFAWNGKWNGHHDGPALFVTAYRHIVDLMRAEGAHNLQWIWHVNWDDDPDHEWNRLENYFPGKDYCDWMAVSAYGPLTLHDWDEPISFRHEIDTVYPRITKLAPGKPIVVAEFGCNIRAHHVRAADWARAALQELFSRRWPGIIGFCWWNETWENDDNPAHDSDLMILHDPELSACFREELAKHRDRIQEQPILQPSR